MLERLPQPLRTPAVARAVTSPSAVLLAGAGTAGAILAGLPLAGAAVVGAVAWAARVALAVPRTPAGERIHPRAVRQPWRHFVQDALQAEARFEQTVARAREGPLRDHLEELGRRLHHGVLECWRIARHGDALGNALDQLDVPAVHRELSELQAEKRRAEGPARASLERAERSMQAQLASVERMAGVWHDAQSRLRALNAHLDEAVARAVELSLTGGGRGDLQPLSAEVDSLVEELESLRQALEETSGPPGATTTAQA